MPQNEYKSIAQPEVKLDMPQAIHPLILASSSIYRAGLLQRFGIKFTQISPDIDESARDNELPSTLASRLGREKARAIATQNPQAWVIGSDQVASIDDVEAIGKPGSPEKAIEQLRQASGRVMRVYTSLSLQNIEQNFDQTVLDVVIVRFRELTDSQIIHYVNTEKPFDCAGSVKSEGLGGALLAQVVNEDPSALIGLPLIKLFDLFEAAGIDLLSRNHPFMTPG
jgi:septum formation protein